MYEVLAFPRYQQHSISFRAVDREIRSVDRTYLKLWHRWSMTRMRGAKGLTIERALRSKQYSVFGLLGDNMENNAG